MEKSIKEKYKLPDSIKVTVTKSKKGFCAFLDDYSGCMTVAKNFGELIENVNDAILTYFEVPRNEAEKIDILYLPEFLNKHKHFNKEVEKKEHKPLRFAPISTQCLYA